MYDLERIRRDFPLLSRVVYLDSAATCQTPVQVIDAMNEYYTEFRANYGRGAYRLVREVTRRYETAREKVAAFIGAETGQIAFTRNSTDSLNMIVGSLNLGGGDHVVVNELEHHSNLIPWLKMRGRTVWRRSRIP